MKAVSSGYRDMNKHKFIWTLAKWSQAMKASCTDGLGLSCSLNLKSSLGFLGIPVTEIHLYITVPLSEDIVRDNS